MKTRIMPVILLVLILSASVNAQEYTFKVLANKGTNEYKSGSQWQPLKTGTSLQKEDELKLSENAYIGLVHSSGKPIEVKNPGIHKVADLASQVKQGSSVLVKYTDFILSNNSAEAKKSRLSATGAVHRTVEGSSLKIMLPPNQSSGIYNDHAVVNWDGSKVKGPYVVKFRNMFDEILIETETPETQIEVDLTDPKLAEENAILIEVSSKENPAIVSEQHLIKKLTPAQQEHVSKELEAIDQEIEGEQALNQYILAGFYEENGLLIDAIAAYEKLLKMEPDVPTYKESYEEFLARNSLQY